MLSAMTTSHGVIDAPPGEDDDEPRIHRIAARARRRVASREWWDHLEYWVGIAIVAACVVFVFTQLAPRELLRNTTLAGGDSGAHVWFPAFLRDHLLPHWRLSGWAPDFYAGFPAGQFYFPLPALLIVAARPRAAVQRRVQARHRGRTAAAADRGVRVRPRPPGAAAHRADVRGGRDRVPVLQGRWRRHADLRPAHHGRHAREHVRGRVLVHARARAVAVLPGHARPRARPARPAVAARGAVRGHAHQPPRGRDLRGDRRRGASGSPTARVATSHASRRSARSGCCSPRCGWCPSPPRSSTRPTCATSRSASAPDSRRTSTGCS